LMAMCKDMRSYSYVCLLEKPTSIKELVEQAAEETSLEKAAIETAIWKLTEQDIAYQPEPGKIRKL